MAQFTDNLQLKIALSIIPQIGPRLVRRLVAYTGGIDAVFKENKRAFEKIPGIGAGKAAFSKHRSGLLKMAEKEVDYILKNDISTFFYLDPNYPIRLRECEDAPIMFYRKGDVDFNAAKVISIVGTRKASDYGRACTQEITKYLAEIYPELIVVSGLAYGIDITAHKAALKNDLSTVAVLAHGFDYIYPSLHASYAKNIADQGALVTEFLGDRKPDPGNFVSRNRIIAGLADATIVVESAKKGGSLITADIANSYNRDVFAVPGRANDSYSQGCNNLIKYNRAGLVERGADVEYAMGWFHEKKKPQATQKTIFNELNAEEQKIISYLKGKGETSLDEICIALKMPIAKVSSYLLTLEFSGMVRPLPGKYFTGT